MKEPRGLPIERGRRRTMLGCEQWQNGETVDERAHEAEKAKGK